MSDGFQFWLRNFYSLQRINGYPRFAGRQNWLIREKDLKSWTASLGDTKRGKRTRTATMSKERELLEYISAGNRVWAPPDNTEELQRSLIKTPGT